MTQKTLPNKFHPAINLYRLSVKRTAGLTVLITVFSLLFCPGYVLMMINSELKYQVNTLNAAAKTVDFADMCPGIIFFTAAASTAIAVLYLFINFSFLYGRSSSDFFHSLPVKRGGLLFSRFFASVVPVLIPITLVYISMGFITAMKSVNGNIKTVIFGFIANVLITVMCCAFSLIFIVCAGSIFDLIISFFTFNLGIIMVQLINASLCGGFLFGFPSVSFGKLFSVSSPFYYAFSGLMRFVTNFSPQRAMLWYAVKLTAVTAVSLVAASLLYNRRRSEKSGVSYAYRFIYVICGLTVGFIGAYGLGFLFADGEYNAVYWIFAVIGALLAAVTFGAINDRGFKTVKKSLVIGGSSFAAMVLAVVILSTGLFGYSKRIPDAESVEKAYVSTISGDEIELDGCQNVLKLHESLIKNGYKKENIDRYIDIEYKLKNGGSLKRRYGINCDDNLNALLSLYKSDEYAKGLKKAFDSKSLKHINVYYYETDSDNTLSAQITPAELGLVIDAYIKDLKNASGGAVTGNNSELFEINAVDKRTGGHIYYQLNIEKSFKNTLNTVNSLRLGERGDNEEEIYQ